MDCAEPLTNDVKHHTEEVVQQKFFTILLSLNVFERKINFVRSPMYFLGTVLIRDTFSLAVLIENMHLIRTRSPSLFLPLITHEPLKIIWWFFHSLVEDTCVYSCAKIHDFISILCRWNVWCPEEQKISVLIRNTHSTLIVWWSLDLISHNWHNML